MTKFESDVLKNYRYDPNSGILTRVSRRNRWGYYEVDEIVGTLSKGYIRTNILGRCIGVHRLAFLFMNGSIPETSSDVDHINRKKDDNRWVNLRLVSRGQNNINSGNPSNNSTGQKGVHPTRGRWFARIKVDQKIIHLGVFKTFDEAVAARKAGEATYFGF